MARESSPGRGDSTTLDPAGQTAASGLATSELVRELVLRVDSIAHGITKSGQDVPIPLDMLADGWGDIVDRHVRAARGKSLRTRALIGRHLISNCIKFYLMCIDDSHRAAQFRSVIDDMATAYANFVRADDEEAAEEERAKSNEHMKQMVKSVMQQVVPMALGMWSGAGEDGLGMIFSSLGINTSETGIDSALGQWFLQ